MNIAILADPNNLPKARQQAEAIRKFGHEYPIVVFTTRLGERDALLAFQGITNCKVSATLPGIVRRPPMNVNEPFLAMAKAMNDSAWFYLSPDTMPIKAGWDVEIAKEYKLAGRHFMGLTGYVPNRYQNSGVEFVNHGQPYMLECGVYPKGYYANTKHKVPREIERHELTARSERTADFHETKLIGNAGWEKTFTVSPEALVVTRLFENVVAEPQQDVVFAPIPSPPTEGDAKLEAEIAALEAEEDPAPLPEVLPNGNLRKRPFRRRGFLKDQPRS